MHSRLEQVLRDLPEWIFDHGEFSKPTELYFHSFNRIDYLISALEKGSFGRKKLTSIGTENSYVPYWNQIWFQPTNVLLLPVFYCTVTESRYSEILEILSERFGQLVGDSDFIAEIGPLGYVKEQEWYHPGPIDLKDIDVEMVVYERRESFDKIAKLKIICQERGYPYTDFPWED